MDFAAHLHHTNCEMVRIEAHYSAIDEVMRAAAA
jgi:hypothetical protein